MINFVGKKNIFFIVSGAIILLGMIAFAIFGGLNLDLDFQGGTAIRMELGQDFNDEDVRKLVSDTIGGHTVAVQKAGTNKTPPSRQNTSAISRNKQNRGLYQNR